MYIETGTLKNHKFIARGCDISFMEAKIVRRVIFVLYVSLSLVFLKSDSTWGKKVVVRNFVTCVKGF